MRIMVTGGCGYVGTVLTNALINKGHEVVVVDTEWFGNYLQKHEKLTIIKDDILNADNISMDGIDTLFHLANIANDPCGDLNSRYTWEVNVLASMRLIEKAISSHVKQFVYASSGSVYGVKEEAQVTEELPLVPISDYNKTKMISERVFLSYQDQISLQIIRPATVCGFSPRMRLDVSVNMLTMQALKNKKITVFGGKQVRPNIHIQDLVNVYLHFLEHRDQLQGIYNAGFENISILDIANRIKEVVECDIVITESNDPRSYRLNSDKLLSTGFKNKKTVNTAIHELVKLYNQGDLADEESYYNVKWMIKKGLI